MIRVLFLAGILALFLAYLVAPVAQRLRRLVHGPRRARPLPRWVAIVVVYAVFGAGAVIAWTQLAPRSAWQIEQLQVMLPRYADQALSRAFVFEQWATARREGWEALVGGITLHVASRLRGEVRAALDEVGQGLPHLRWLWLVPVLSFVMLQAFPAFRRSAVRAAPSGHLRWRVDEFFNHVNAVLAGYMRGQVVAALFVTVMCSALLAALKIPYALSIGLAAGALEFLPIVGPLTIALTVLMLADGVQLVAALAGLGALRAVQDYYLYPRLVGRGMHLRPLAVIVALLIGARVGGIVGVAAAVPLVGVLSVAWRHYRDHRAIERLVHAGETARARAAEAVAAAQTPTSDGETG